MYPDRPSRDGYLGRCDQEAGTGRARPVELTLPGDVLEAARGLVGPRGLSALVSVLLRGEIARRGHGGAALPAYIDTAGMDPDEIALLLGESRITPAPAGPHPWRQTGARRWVARVDHGDLLDALREADALGLEVEAGRVVALSARARS